MWLLWLLWNTESRLGMSMIIMKYGLQSSQAGERLNPIRVVEPPNTSTSTGDNWKYLWNYTLSYNLAVPVQELFWWYRVHLYQCTWDAGFDADKGPAPRRRSKSIWGSIQRWKQSTATSENNAWGDLKTIHGEKWEQSETGTSEHNSWGWPTVGKARGRDKTLCVFHLGVTEPTKERGGKDRAEGHDEEGQGNLGDGQVQAGGQEGRKSCLEK